MHPAGSVILFTTLTGFGYGLLVWLSVTLLIKADLPPELVLWSLAIATLNIVVGLCSSLWHLGHPERAWRAMSQWRSSWLSREGVSAVLSFLPILLLAVASFWQISELYLVACLLVILLSLVTVYATSMIYASLKPIAAWYNCYTILGYLLHALVCGGVAWQFLLQLFGQFQQQFSWQLSLPLMVIVVLALVNKLLWFRQLNYGQSDLQTAIGIKGRIRQLDPPHSAANYLMKEMGYVMVRKYALVLRWVAVMATFVIPLGFLALGLLALGWLGAGGVVATGGALLSCSVGIIAERFLFFAEAKHTVSLYYQR